MHEDESKVILIRRVRLVLTFGMKGIIVNKWCYFTEVSNIPLKSSTATTRIGATRFAGFNLRGGIVISQTLGIQIT